MVNCTVLQDEMVTCMKLLGVKDISELGPRCVSYSFLVCPPGADIVSVPRSTAEWLSVTSLTGEQGSTMPGSGRPGRSSDQAGRESRISKNAWWALESARTISGCLARLSWMPVPSTPMRPRPNPGKNCLHQRWCGFPAAFSYRFIQMLPPSNPSGYPLRNASLVLTERNTYGIVSFRSSHKRVLELPSRWVARIKDACFLPFPRVLILEAGIWFHHEAATASEFRQLCGQPWESRRHDRRLVTTPNAPREAKSHVVLFMSCISRNLPLPHKHLDGPQAIWPCCLGRWKTDWSGVLEMSERLKSQTSKPIYIHL